LSFWLIAAWLIALLITVTVWHNVGRSRMQRRIAKQRPGLDRNAYATDMGKSGVCEAVSKTLYDCVKPLCVKGVQPHPDDSLIGFYFDDGEDLEDLLEELFEKLELPLPDRYEPEVTPHLNSARDLGIYLQSKISS
jgi:hypothetical protein